MHYMYGKIIFIYIVHISSTFKQLMKVYIQVVSILALNSKTNASCR